MADELVVSRLGGAIYVGEVGGNAPAPVPAVVMRVIKAGVRLEFTMSPGQAAYFSRKLAEAAGVPHVTETRPEGA